MFDRARITTPHPFHLVGALAVAAAIAASPAGAQEDARWLPWIGCWEAAEAEYGEGEMLCVRTVDGGAELMSVAGGEITSTEIFRADGRVHPVDWEGCEGERAVRFSDDRRRVFVSSETTCEGEYSRNARGLMAMTSPTSWVDVQVVEYDGRDVAGVRVYRQAPRQRVEEAGLTSLTAGRGMAIQTARREASGGIDIDAVVETADAVGNEAAKAWIARARQPFDLDGETLVALADAGLQPDVIDVMVAVSYPDEFVLDGEPTRYEDDDRYARRYGQYDPYGYYGPYGYGYRSWLGYRYGFSPYYLPGFGRGYGYGYGYTPTVIVVTERGDRRGGRIVKGRGYTRDHRGVGGGGSSVDRPRGQPAGGSSVGSGSRGSTGTKAQPRKAKKKGGGGGE